MYLQGWSVGFGPVLEGVFSCGEVVVVVLCIWNVNSHCLYCVMMLVHVSWTLCGVSQLYSTDVCLPVICLLHKLEIHTGPELDSMSSASSVLLLCIL